MTPGTMMIIGQEITFSLDGRLLASSLFDELKLMTIASGRSEQVGSGGGSISALAFSPDGKRVASGTREGRVVLWRLQAGGRQAARQIGLHRNNVTAVCFSPDGQLLASGCDAGELRLWNANTGERIRLASAGGAFAAWPSVKTASGWPRAPATVGAAFGTWSPSRWWERCSILMCFTWSTWPSLKMKRAWPPRAAGRLCFGRSMAKKRRSGRPAEVPWHDHLVRLRFRFNQVCCVHARRRTGCVARARGRLHPPAAASAIEWWMQK